MKQAIKVLEKRIELLSTLWTEKAKSLEECELPSDYEFLRNDIVNIELELPELQEAIKILNQHVK